MSRLPHGFTFRLQVCPSRDVDLVIIYTEMERIQRLSHTRDGSVKRELDVLKFYGVWSRMSFIKKGIFALENKLAPVTYVVFAFSVIGCSCKGWGRMYSQGEDSILFFSLGSFKRPHRGQFCFCF